VLNINEKVVIVVTALNECSIVRRSGAVEGSYLALQRTDDHLTCLADIINDRTHIEQT